MSVNDSPRIDRLVVDEHVHHIVYISYVYFSLLAALVSGVVVNTCGYIRQEGYESFKHVAKEFDGRTTSC
jgi:hypothetical protein